MKEEEGLDLPCPQKQPELLRKKQEKTVFKTTFESMKDSNILKETWEKSCGVGSDTRTVTHEERGSAGLYEIGNRSSEDVAQRARR